MHLTLKFTIIPDDSNGHVSSMVLQSKQNLPRMRRRQSDELLQQRLMAESTRPAVRRIVLYLQVNLNTLSLLVNLVSFTYMLLSFRLLWSKNGSGPVYRDF